MIDLLETDRQTALAHSEFGDWIIALQLLTFENNLSDATNLEWCGQSKQGHVQAYHTTVDVFPSFKTINISR